MTWVFNLERPALKPLATRQALAAAIDRERIVRDVIFGQGRVAQAPLASGIGFAHAPETLAHLRHDPAAARDQLAKLSLKLDIVHFPQFSRYADALRQDLAAAGVQLSSRPLDRAASIEAIFTKRDFDTALISYCQGADPEIGARRMYVSSAIGKVPFSNASGWSRPEVDAAFDRGLTTTAPAERARAYRQAQQIIARELPYLWLVETDFPVAWRADLDGLAPWRGSFAETARVR